MPQRTTAPGLAPQQIEQFDRDGFIVTEGILEAPLIESLISEVEALETDERATRIRRGSVFARRNILDTQFARQMLAQPVVTEIVEALGPNSRPVRGILFDKTGAANWTVPWHQDRSIAVLERIDAHGYGPWSTKAGIIHVQPPIEVLRQMITLRFHLDPCNPDNGPLRVISSTHQGILDQAQIESLLVNSPPHSCTVEAGGLVIMRPLILHASSPAAKPSHRRVIHLEFGPSTLPGGVHWAHGSEPQ
jgi:ectoine hydroxylase-related dioxygenase (phytanoyl-CoA dioxygenase family)